MFSFGTEKPWQPETWQDSTLFSPPVGHFGPISLLNYTVNLEKRGKSPLEKIQKNPVETAPRNCRFLSFVVVEHVLIPCHSRDLAHVRAHESWRPLGSLRLLAMFCFFTTASTGSGRLPAGMPLVALSTLDPLSRRHRLACFKKQPRPSFPWFWDFLTFFSSEDFIFLAFLLQGFGGPIKN